MPNIGMGFHQVHLDIRRIIGHMWVRVTTIKLVRIHERLSINGIFIKTQGRRPCIHVIIGAIGICFEGLHNCVFFDIR